MDLCLPPISKCALWTQVGQLKRDFKYTCPAGNDWASRAQVESLMLTLPPPAVDEDVEVLTTPLSFPHRSRPTWRWRPVVL